MIDKVIDVRSIYYTHLRSVYRSFEHTQAILSLFLYYVNNWMENIDTNKFKEAMYIADKE